MPNPRDPEKPPRDGAGQRAALHRARRAAAGLGLALALSAGCAPRAGGSLAGPPRLILWSWQRSDDLTFLNPRQAGVAYLVATVHLRGNGFRVEPNLNPLRLPAGVWLMAVVRMDADPADPPAVASAALVRFVAKAVVSAASAVPEARALQLDFDARQSQQAFYRRVILAVHRRAPRFPLSITALASWCLGDDWLSGLPVAEAVPMLFNMGGLGNTIRRRWSSGLAFPEPLCNRSAGISLGRSVPVWPAGRRIYLFAPAGWSPAEWRSIRAAHPSPP